MFKLTLLVNSLPSDLKRLEANPRVIKMKIKI